MFVSEAIKVTRDKKDNTPVEFFWRGQRKQITRIISTWQDWGFSEGVFKAGWRQRHHRNYFKVECNDNKVYEIYLDRKTEDKPIWVLYRIIG